MSNKRKLDIMEIDFEAIQNNLILMSKRSLSDSKSFLLMVKSLAPNSIRLKLMEYQLAKENEDAVTASQLLCQLYNSQEDISKEIRNLFTGILTNPSDKICSDILSKLSVDIQCSLLKSYFKDQNDLITKADTIIQLLNSSDIQLYPDSVCFLLDLVCKTLQDGEHVLLEKRTKHPMKLNQTEAWSPNHSLHQSESYKLEDLDEGEEGEVIGDDDEEDESLEDREDDESHYSTNPCSESTLNVYRFKMACEILPIAARISTNIKLEKKLLFMIASCSLNFLSTYLTSFKSIAKMQIPNVQLCDHLIKDPQTYLVEVMTMLGSIFQWNTSLLSRFCTSSCPSDLTDLLPDGLNQLAEWISEIKLVSGKSTDKECSNLSKSRRQRRRGGRQNSLRKSSSDSWHDLRSKPSCLSFQTICFYWFLLIRTGLDYLSIVRPNLFDSQSSSSSIQSVLTCFPIDLISQFGLPSSQQTNENKSRQTILFEALHWLFGLRNYVPSSSPGAVTYPQYTFGCMELDEMDKLIRPSPSKVDTETIFEMVLHLDLTLAGLTHLGPKPFDQLGQFFELGTKSPMTNNPYQGVDYLFLQWWFDIHLLSGQFGDDNIRVESSLATADLRSQLTEFMTQFELICANLTQSNQKPIDQVSTFAFVPLTKPNLVYLATKLLTQWLCSRVKQYPQNKSVTSHAASIACVLCQLDTPTYPIPVSNVQWNSPYPVIGQFIEKFWPIVRENFAHWLTSDHHFIFDVGLLCRLVEIESNRIDNSTELNGQSFAAQCMAQIQTTPSLSPDCIMKHFISSESDRIIQCLTTLYE